MNNLVLSGYAKYISMKGRVLSLKLLSTRPVRPREGEMRSFLMQVRVYGNPPKINDGDYVVISGRLDAHKYGDRTYYELNADSNGVIIGKERSSEPGPPPGYPLPPADDDSAYPAVGWDQNAGF